MTDTVNVPQEMIDAVMKVPVGLDEDGAEVFPGPFAAAELVRVALAAAPKAEPAADPAADLASLLGAQQVAVRLGPDGRTDICPSASREPIIRVDMTLCLSAPHRLRLAEALAAAINAAALAAAPKAEPEKTDPQIAFENMRRHFPSDRRDWADLTPEQRKEWEEDVSERPHLYDLRTQPEAPKVEQEPVDCPACYRGEVFGLSMDNGFWVEMGWSSGGANPAGINGEIQLIEHHPDGKVIERVYVAKDSPAFPAPASDELLEDLCFLLQSHEATEGEGISLEIRLSDLIDQHKGPQS